MYKKIILIFIIAAGICMQSNAQAKHRVVIQMSSSDTAAWHSLINNIKHLQEAFNKEVQIEVVAHGPGIDLLVKSKTTQLEKIAELKNTGVLFSACMNTMKAKNITKDAIVGEAGFVPSGVAEIVSKEEAGWSYLKGGF